MIMKFNFFKLFLIIAFGLFLTQCSTYSIKKDMSQKGELKKTPKWYIKYDREDKKWMYETATSVSPDIELAVKKSILLAKSKLADRINGKMNNQSTINKSESGLNENNTLRSASEDTIINIVGDTFVKDYVVDQVEIFFTHHKSYRAYVKVKVSKENISEVFEQIERDKKLAALSNKKSNDLSQKVEEVLNNID
tara:strand:- start:891 stop:1472 length:582 start_codon:yes stop_codon:yes gene_type:complete